MFHSFDKCDKDGSGIISRLEWFMFLDIEKTEFNEKVFSIADIDGTDDMDFREFVMCCWNFASATPSDLTNFAFLMYSSDGALLKSEEVLGMLRSTMGENIETNKRSMKVRDDLMFMAEEHQGIDLSQVSEELRLCCGIGGLEAFANVSGGRALGGNPLHFRSLSVSFSLWFDRAVPVSCDFLDRGPFPALLFLPPLPSLFIYSVAYHGLTLSFPFLFFPFLSFSLSLSLVTLVSRCLSVSLSLFSLFCLQFGEFCKGHGQLLEPCFNFQRLLRSKVIGPGFWKRQMNDRIKKFEGSTWTDIYEDLKGVAEEEIRKDELHRKGKNWRGLKRIASMGSFKLPKAELPTPKKGLHKKKKGPKFLNKRLKEKERYSVLADIFENVDLEKLEARNSRVTEEHKENAKDGEFAHVTSVLTIEHQLPGSDKLDFMRLTELEALGIELRRRIKKTQEKKSEAVRAVDDQPKVRGLFDYENTKDGDGGIKATLAKQRTLRLSIAQPSKRQSAMSMFKKAPVTDAIEQARMEAATDM